MQLARWFFLFCVLLICSSTWAAPLECRLNLALLKFTETPQLANDLRESLLQPDFPTLLRNQIMKSLENPGFGSVIRVTPEIKRLYKFSSTTWACLLTQPGLVHCWYGLEPKPAWIDELPKPKSKFELIVPESNSTGNGLRDFQALSILVHELAHIRFKIYLEKNIRRLVSIFPENQIREDPDGRFGVSSHLWSFLLERHAKELELAFLKARGFKNRSILFYLMGLHECDSFDLTERNQNAISEFVISEYKITDPEVLPMRNRSLRDILQNGMITSSQSRRGPSVLSARDVE